MGISQFLTVAANTASGNPEPSVGVVVATGLILVFGVLVLLYLLITLEGIIFTSVDRKKKGAPAPKKEAAPAPVKAAAPKAPVVEAGIPGEVVAAISAAVASMMGGKPFAVRSIKRKKQTRPAWGAAGIVENTRPF